MALKLMHNTITTQIDNIKSLARNDVMEGRDWLVVPTQMITEGVHNGDGGPIFYPANELAKLPVVWNQKPVVVYHPKRNGQGVSACDPIEVSVRKVGVIMNTNWNDTTKQLAAEAWLDTARADLVDKRVNESIKNNTVMEVSTGLFMDLDETPGEFNGKSYIGIARNLQPDHLALLPDKKGACSIADGAGFLRANESTQANTQTNVQTNTQNELSANKLRDKLSLVLKGKSSDPNTPCGWIVDVYDKYFIYEKLNQYYKQLYNINSKDEVILSGPPIIVIQQVTYVPATLRQNNQETQKIRVKNNYAIIDGRRIYVGNGGSGSGNFGHAGRPGEIGGSGGGSGITQVTLSVPKGSSIKKIAEGMSKLASQVGVDIRRGFGTKGHSYDLHRGNKYISIHVSTPKNAIAEFRSAFGKLGMTASINGDTITIKNPSREKYNKK